MTDLRVSVADLRLSLGDFPLTPSARNTLYPLHSAAMHMAFTDSPPASASPHQRSASDSSLNNVLGRIKRSFSTRSAPERVTRSNSRTAKGQPTTDVFTRIKRSVSDAAFTSTMSLARAFSVRRNAGSQRPTLPPVPSSPYTTTPYVTVLETLSVESRPQTATRIAKPLDAFTSNAPESQLKRSISRPKPAHLNLSRSTLARGGLQTPPLTPEESLFENPREAPPPPGSARKQAPSHKPSLSLDKELPPLPPLRASKSESEIGALHRDSILLPSPPLLRLRANTAPTVVLSVNKPLKSAMKRSASDDTIRLGQGKRVAFDASVPTPEQVDPFKPTGTEIVELQEHLTKGFFAPRFGETPAQTLAEKVHDLHIFLNQYVFTKGWYTPAAARDGLRAHLSALPSRLGLKDPHTPQWAAVSSIDEELDSTSQVHNVDLGHAINNVNQAFNWASMETFFDNVRHQSWSLT